MVITNSTLNNSVWNAVKTRIVAGLSADSITASVEAKYTNKVVTKPVVVIESIGKGKSQLKFNSTGGLYNITQGIFILASSSLDSDTVCQAIENYVEADDIDGISYKSHVKSADFQEVNDSEYHMNYLSISYQRESNS